MSIASAYTATHTYTGDLNGTVSVNGVANANAPPPTHVNLVVGDNTITVPVSPDTPLRVMIIKPKNNAVAIKFKGAGGDTGVRLHNTETDTITLDPSAATFILNAGAGGVSGVVLAWG